ncbi:MAG: acyltransferase [Pseudomonadota bacterium]
MAEQTGQGTGLGVAHLGSPAVGQRSGLLLQNIQALRALAAVLVFFVHYEDLEQKRGGVRLFGEWADAGAAGVDLFFVISGFVMVLTTRNVRGAPRDGMKFILARVFRIYPLWWLCLTALTVVWLLKPGMVYSGSAGFEPDWLRDYLLVTREHSPLLQVGWTLVYEMYFYVVFMGILFLPIGLFGRFIALVVWFGLVVLGSLTVSVTNGTQLFLMLSPLNLEFLLGGFAAFAYLWGRGILAAQALCAGGILFLIGLALYASPATEAVFAGIAYQKEWPRALLFGVPSLLIVYGAASLEAERRWLISPWLSTVGDWSYSLYLTHMMTLGALGIIWAKLHVNTVFGHVLALVFVLGGCLFVSFLSYRLFEVPVNRVAKRLRSRL